jgi:hypothetical protein
MLADGGITLMTIESRLWDLRKSSGDEKCVEDELL